MVSFRTALTLILINGGGLGPVSARLAGECAMICNDLRGEVLTVEMCREAKRTLPRPKVGDFCSTAMEQGFSDACVSLCMDQRPVVRVAQTCRAAAVEMPRPTVRKWCEHGYNVAFSKTTEDLATHFKPDRGGASALEQNALAKADEIPFVESKTEQEPGAEVEQTTLVTDNVANESSTRGEGVVVAKFPVTLGGRALNLSLMEGESVEDAVVSFCKEHVNDDISACIRQMLPEVLERMEENGSSSGLRGAP